MKMVDVIINGYAKFLAIVLCLLFYSPVAAIISVVGVALSAVALQGLSRHSGNTSRTKAGAGIFSMANPWVVTWYPRRLSVSVKEVI